MVSPSAGVETRVRRYYAFQILVAFQLWSPFWSLWLFTKLTSGAETNYFLATLVDVVFWIVSLVVAIPAGAIADRYGRKPALIVGIAIWMTGIVLFGLSTDFLGFAFANGVWAFGAAFLWGATSAYLYDTLVEVHAETRYPAVSSRVAMFSFLGTGLASLLGGALVSLTNRLDLTLLAYALPGLGALALAWTFQEPTVRREPEANLLAQIRGGLRTTRRNRQIVLVIVFQLLVGLVTYVMGFFRPALIVGVTEHNYLLMGTVYAGFFCIAAVSGRAVDRLLRRFGEFGGLVLTFLLVFPPFILVFTVSQGFFAPDLAFGLGVLSQVFDYAVWGIEGPLITTILNRRVASNDRATVLSINSFFSVLVIAITEPVVGIVATNYNFGVGLAVLALAASFPTVYVLWRFRHIEHESGVFAANAAAPTREH